MDIYRVKKTEWSCKQSRESQGILENWLLVVTTVGQQEKSQHLWNEDGEKNEVYEKAEVLERPTV